MLLAWALGPLTFGTPVVFYATVAVAAPILLHLLLRPRPRPLAFPAVRFLLHTHVAAQRRHRLRRWLLLAMRVGVIVLLVLLFAKPELRAAGDVKTSHGAASIVLAFDNSASMQYRFANETRLDAAKRIALERLGDPARFDEGSEFLVLTNAPGAGSDADDEARAFVDRDEARNQIEAILPADHDGSIGLLLRRAARRLEDARLPTHVVLLLHDGTAHAWRDVGAPLRAELGDIRVETIDVGVSEDRNYRLDLPDMPNRPIPPDVPVGLDVSVTTGADCNPSDDVFVTLFVDGEAKRRERATALAPGSSAAMQLLLPPLSKDRHRIRVELQPDDPLSVDNVRYGCVEVAEPPTVAVVAETSTSPVLNTGDVLANMLAPAALPLSRQRLRIERHSPGECDDLDWSRFRGVLLANVAALGTRAWHELADFTQQGGTVVCVLGDAVSVDRYDEAGGLLPALPTRIVTDTEPAHLVVCDAQNALARPLLSPALAPLELRQIYRRWSVKPADKGVTPIVSFSDGAPAILVREIGRGRCILLALSPDAAWSDLAAHAAPLLVFLQEAFAQAARASEGTGNALVGSTAIVGLESLGGAASAPLEAFFASVAQSPSRLDIPLTGARALLPTDRPGHVLVRARGQAEPGYLLAVNVATAETALTRVDSAKLAWVASGNTASQPVPAPPEGAGVASTSRRIDLLVPAALLALALIIAESAFANRIYKNSPAAAARERPGNLTT